MSLQLIFEVSFCSSHLNDIVMINIPRAHCIEHVQLYVSAHMGIYLNFVVLHAHTLHKL